MDIATYAILNKKIKNVEKDILSNNSLHLTRKIVDKVPSAAEADEHTIYLLKKENVTGEDKYEEYMLIDGTIQKIGDTSVDLSNYATIEKLNEELQNKVDKEDGKTLSSNDFTDDDKTKLESLSNYNDTEVKNLIIKNTENIENNINNISQLQTTVNSLKNYDDTEIRELVKTNTENISTNFKNITQNTTDIEELQSTVNNLSNYDDTEIKEKIATLSSTKLDKQQGTSNAGKFLSINTDGDIYITTLPDVTALDVEYDDEQEALSFVSGTAQRDSIVVDDTLVEQIYKKGVLLSYWE